VSGPDIQPMLDVLERDEALDLGAQEEKLDDEHEVVPTDWPAMFPGRPVRDGEHDWDVHGGDWELDGDIAEELARAASAGGEFPVELPMDDGPGDIVRDDDGGIWDICAWYQPMHFFGHDWGIFIRQDCLLRFALQIAWRVRTPAPIRDPQTFGKAVIRAAFASFYLHEHFHHKVESMGLRLHVTRGASSYVPYNRNVYQKTYLTDDCLEEALANADAWHRLGTSPYKDNIGRTLVDITKDYLRYRFRHMEPPGYRKAADYLTKPSLEGGFNRLQGQIKEGTLTPAQPASDWKAAPQLLRSYFSLRSDIYTVVPRGARPIVPSRVFPKTCSTRDMQRVCERRGYRPTSGGKGSHVKLKDPEGHVITLPGNRKDLSPGVVSKVLKQLGDFSPNDLPSLVRNA
jgi:predicted RNA binding protein YcfA (HicA-like mRNA interferase family)